MVSFQKRQTYPIETGTRCVNGVKNGSNIVKMRQVYWCLRGAAAAHCSQTPDIHRPRPQSLHPAPAHSLVRVLSLLLGDLGDVLRLIEVLSDALHVGHAARIVEDRALVRLVLAAIDEPVLVHLGGAGHAKREQRALQLRFVRLRVARLAVWWAYS